MSNIILSRDDLTSYLENIGIVDKIKAIIPCNYNFDTVLDILSNFAGIQISEIQLKQVLADLIKAEKIEWLSISGDSLPSGIVLPVKPTGLGIGNGNVWANAPEATYIFRFYVNGIHKLTLQDYYITSLASVGATSGDEVAIAVVAAADVLEGETIITPAGTVGWWAKGMVA